MPSTYEYKARRTKKYQRECDECRCAMDKFKAKDGMCIQCHTLILRCYELQARLPDHLVVRDIKGYHTKPCSDCGTCDWLNVRFYVNLDYLHKYCIDCAELKNWESVSSVDQDDDGNKDANSHARWIQKEKNRNQVKEWANVGTNQRCLRSSKRRIF